MSGLSAVSGRVRFQPVTEGERWNLGNQLRSKGATIADIERVRRGLPKLDRGFAWACTGQDTTGLYFRVVLTEDFARFDKTSALRSIASHIAVEQSAVRKINLREGEKLPPAPAGYEWKLLGILESFPPQYSYALVKKK